MAIKQSTRTARVVWKGAIVFGLVHIPVDLYPGSKESDLDFDWIDKRDNAPVGYQRVNKTTGKPVEMADIVKGYEWQKGSYVILKAEDFKAANPKATQTVEILAFVDRASIAPQFFEKPYRLVPGKRGEKGYALLRETLQRTDKVGVAQVVIRNRQHLAALMPFRDMLGLIAMRYADEVLGAEDLDLPTVKDAGVSDKEVQLAQRLVLDMSEDFNPAQYRDTYRDDLMKRIEALATKGRTYLVRTPAAEDEKDGAQIIDLMAALKRSLETKGPKSAGKPAAKRELTAARATQPEAATKSAPPRTIKAAARKRA